MTKRRLFSSALLIAVLAFGAIPLSASDPCGVYGVVEKVVLEPNDTEPTTVQVWGVFALSDAKFGGGYGAAQRGYFYYTCTKGRDTACINEWNDLKSVAGKDQFVGFGGRYLPTGRFRKADEKPASPDAYPIQMGVMRFGPAAVLADVQAVLKKK
jgi:hypothetical protein